MAQSPVSLQEPSMDELLASIREIIEESSAAAEAAELSTADSQSHEHGQEAHGQAILPDARGDKQSNLSQEDSLASAAMPIHDAMKALAARIGLKKQSDLSASAAEEVSSSPLSFIPPAAPVPMTAPAIVAPPIAPAPVAFSDKAVPPLVDAFAQSQVNVAQVNVAGVANNHSVPNLPFAQEQKSPAAIAPLSPGSAQTPRPLPQMSLSASIPAAPAAAKIKKPQSVKISPTPSPVTAENKAMLPTGHIPLYPQLRSFPLSQQSQPRTLPGQTQQGQTLPSQAPSQAAPAALLSPQNPASLEKPSLQGAKILPEEQESHQVSSAVEKGSLAEFEQSAELLLRPYIAGWLEEHFHHLFEKILREEIQRLMQKNLHR